MPKPVCFMIMPYGRKPTEAEAGKGPAEIDFNALWDRGYVPVIQQLGYEPVRADQDTGAMIISQMLERLYFSDLVLADMTTPNGNVYYEVGIRHAAKRNGCVLFAADWSRRLFDVAQFRTINYPLPEGEITESTALAFQAAIKDKISGISAGVSPMFESLPGYPTDVHPDAASSMRDEMTKLAAFQTRLRAVRAAPASQRMELAKALVASDGKMPMTYPVALALLSLLRDCADTPADWNAVIDFAQSLPNEFTQQAVWREQLAFAVSQTGNVIESIAQLQTLISTVGPTPERLGLLGGRYKRLINLPTASPGERLGYLAKAIDCYERGMDLDLNDYYCSCNLPRLYRRRAGKGDEERAQNVLRLVIAACERAKRRDATDEWLRPTLLGAAFDLDDADKAEELVDVILAEGGAGWKLKSTLSDIEASAGHVKDEALRARLLAVVARLKLV
jgi:Tetratricopeptide Repeats-Sensor